jgi:hypothetical protein
MRSLNALEDKSLGIPNDFNLGGDRAAIAKSVVRLIF